MTTFEIHNIPFMFLSGKIIAIEQIQSIIPSLKHGGSMVFLQNTEKALLANEPPEEIVKAVTNERVPRR